MKLKNILPVIIVGIILLLILFKNDEKTLPMATVGGSNAFALSNATTSTAVAVTSSTRVLATTTSTTGTSYTRVYSTICNPSSTIVYLRMDSDKAASVTSGIPIGAAAGYNACYEITDRNMYQGSIQASSTNQTSVSILVNDYVK